MWSDFMLDELSRMNMRFGSTVTVGAVPSGACARSVCDAFVRAGVEPRIAAKAAVITKEGTELAYFMVVFSR
jgi:hypothetical protein